MIEGFDKYIQSLNIGNKLVLFIKKTDYLDSLLKYSVEHYGNDVAVFNTGYGNVNSSIMIELKDISYKKSFETFFAKIFSKINLNIWDCYVTFYYKTDNNNFNSSPITIQWLSAEEKCINPSVKITVGDTDNLNDICNLYIDCKKLNDEEYIKQVSALIYKFIPYK